MLTKWKNLFARTHSQEISTCQSELDKNSKSTKEIAAILEDNLEAIQETKNKLVEARFNKSTIIDRQRQKRSTTEWLKGNSIKETMPPIDQNEMRVRLSNSGNYEILDPMPDMEESFMAFSKEVDPFFENDKSLELRQFGSSDFASWISGNEMQSEYDADRASVMDLYLDSHGFSSKNLSFAVDSENVTEDEDKDEDVSLASCNKRYLNDLMVNLEQRISDNQSRAAYWTDSCY